MSLLTLNAGSSSLKFALFPDDGDDAPALLSGMIEGLGTRARLLVTHTNGTQRVDEPLAPTVDAAPHEARGHAPSAGARSMVNDTDEALALVLARLPEWTAGEAIRAIGHRVVHGGIRYAAPALIDDRVLADLNALTALAPLHQPFNLRAIAAAQRRFPGVPHVACFDTAFHRGHAFVHDAFALPRELHEAGVRRYGFHGLSYEFIARRLRTLDPGAATGRTVVAHLGSGASLCALREGRSVASSMGFSALDGLPMGTRPGQLDAGVLLWLMTERQMDAAALTDLLYRRSGLAGLSGMGGDMRTLQASTEPAAREAVARHRDRGEHIAVVTATHDFLAAGIVALFGPVPLVATRCELVEGRFTGRTDGPPCFGPAKRGFVDAWLAAQGQAWADFRTVRFYSDSANDLPLLEAASEPVVVDPDPRLAAIAAERGWARLSWRVDAEVG